MRKTKETTEYELVDRFFRLIWVLYRRGIITPEDKAYIECKISFEEYLKMIKSEKGDNRI